MRMLITHLIALLLLVSCGTDEPKPIKLNNDSCDFCKMTISNGKFGAELITEKGRYYKFDDVSCMIQFAKSNTVVPYKSFYVADYSKDNTLILAEQSFFLKGGTISSPMRGNTIAFSTKKGALAYQQKLNAELKTWKEIYSTY
ncbi:nitrous oxide reductase accessory protein NosL [Flavobacterium sp. RSB2_4_14]|uniref:nitrous oxide reductase accessory protein NosL n=1 Tax=Flavobacterium sp. RSB2_4_14 TaxID=3447665 RepID=UPI003F31874C